MGATLVAVHGILIVVASFVVEHGLWGTRVSVAVAHGLSYPLTCGIFMDQGSNLWCLPW